MCFPRVLIATLSTSLFVSSLRSDTSASEPAFARERSTLTCMNGPTDEPSCGGTDMDVYLRGEEVRKLDWWVEMSNKWVREEYFFSGSQPVLVIETIEKKYDSHGELLSKPELVSRQRYRLDQVADNARAKKFLEHAQFLLHDFQKHRSEFSPCIRPHI
jgi:hypothetical protein